MMQLEKQEFVLSTGQKALSEYEPDSDLLEIILSQAEATSAVELTESIILRFDRETNEPLSLNFMSISRLVQPGEYGEIHFQLLMDEWPAEIKDEILAMLHQPPLNEFLTLSSYAPAHTHQIVPLATIKQPRLAALAA